MRASSLDLTLHIFFKFIPETFTIFSVILTICVYRSMRSGTVFILAVVGCKPGSIFVGVGFNVCRFLFCYTHFGNTKLNLTY